MSGGPGAFGMGSDDGERAVGVLVSRVVSEIVPPVDLDQVSEALNEGVALIAVMHPEVYSPLVIEAVYSEVAQAIAGSDPAIADRR